MKVTRMRNTDEFNRNESKAVGRDTNDVYTNDGNKNEDKTNEANKD